MQVLQRRIEHEVENTSMAALLLVLEQNVPAQFLSRSFLAELQEWRSVVCAAERHMESEADLGHGAEDAHSDANDGASSSAARAVGVENVVRKNAGGAACRTK